MRSSTGRPGTTTESYSRAASWAGTNRSTIIDVAARHVYQSSPGADMCVGSCTQIDVRLYCCGKLYADRSAIILLYTSYIFALQTDVVEGNWYASLTSLIGKRGGHYRRSSLY
ncbi:unnamed protein product [Ectocarpus sp. 12 AP-2014]